MQVVIIAGIFILGIHCQATMPVSTSHIQNQTVFSGLAECGQQQPLCVCKCKPYSESDGVFWSCRVRAATAPLCLQAMFRIRLFSGLPEHGQRQPLHARAAANSQEHSAATAQLPGQDRQQQQSLRASHRLQASRPQISARSAPHD